MGYDVGQKTIGTYKSIQVNDNFLNHFSLSVNEGRLFLEKDYLAENDILPVLLGYDYKNYCKLNQKITLYYLGKKFTCEIIGFLDDNSYYNNGYNIELLNRYILLPSLEINSDKSNITTKEKNFQLKLFLDKCAGYLDSNQTGSYLQNLITAQCYNLDIPPYSLEGVLDFYPTMWGLEGKSLLNIIIVFVAIILISTTLCMSINMSSKIIFLKRNFAIYILNGLDKKIIYIYVALEIILMNLISSFLATFFQLLISGHFSIFFFINYKFYYFLSFIYLSLYYYKQNTYTYSY